jgi:hypothetical protein
MTLTKQEIYKSAWYNESSHNANRKHNEVSIIWAQLEWLLSKWQKIANTGELIEKE